MLLVTIGLILIAFSAFLIYFGIPQLKVELTYVKENSSRKKTIFVYIVTFLGLFDFGSYFGWLLSLGLLFVASGSMFILLSIFT